MVFNIRVNHNYFKWRQLNILMYSSDAIALLVNVNSFPDDDFVN